MNADFSNTYQEVLLDNLMVIIKQNFMFQTQLKIAGDVGNKNTELQSQIEKLYEENVFLNQKAQEVDSYKSRAETNVSAHEEKSRIQVALNDEMKKTSALQGELDTIKKEIDIRIRAALDVEIKKTSELQTELGTLKEEIDVLKSYVKQLEEIAPITKLKKVNPSFKSEKKAETVETVIEPTPIELPTKVNDGSSF